MNVGLFFGSFNPVHVGHMIIAQGALNQTPLDRIWFVVSPQNPLKDKKTLLSEYDRLRMVELAIGENMDMMASNIEFGLPKPSYTIDTLRHLSKLHPEYKFALIMGEDNLDTLHKWKEYEEILRKYKVYCHPRAGGESGKRTLHENVELFDLHLLDISATRIREMLKSGKSARYMVPSDAYDYLMSHNLYVD